MNILFVHKAFPGQFIHLAPALAAQGHRVVGLGSTSQAAGLFSGVEVVRYEVERGSATGIHPLAQDIESKIIRADAALKACRALKARGFDPDIIIAFHRRGESLFLKELWPSARMGIYCEFFLGVNASFDPEFEREDPRFSRLQNIIDLLHFDADAAISPTHWQANTFPSPLREKIAVIHDGIDTDVVAPNAGASVTINGKIALTKGDEVVTYVNRNLEPYRGFHVFIRAIPEILKRRPRARILIVGAETESYGPLPPAGHSWKSIFVSEVRPQISDAEWGRVHFVGQLPYSHFVALLQVSSVHVYLTYPFVLSWSLLEAMSAGCAVVGSDTAPVREVISHDETGRLVDFFDVQGLAGGVCSLLGNPKERERLGKNAREFVRENYDLKTVCLPKQLEWITSVASSGSSL